jgi:hypothetical protein
MGVRQWSRQCDHTSFLRPSLSLVENRQPVSSQTDSRLRFAQLAYRVALFILGVVAVAFFVLATAVSMRAAFAELLRAFGDGALVALVVALVVEPYLRTRFMLETQEDVLWGLLNPRADVRYRQAIQAIAGVKHYFEHTEWLVSFDWEDVTQRILKVTLEARNDGLAVEEYVPDRQLWAIGSTAGYESAYLHWSLTVLNVQAWASDHTFDREQLIERGFAQVDSNGMVFVDESKIANGRSIPADTRYRSVKKFSMSRHDVGYLPLAHTRPCLSDEIVLNGSALGDLEVSFFSPESRNGEVSPVEARLDGKSGLLYRSGGIALPGGVLLVSWRPSR